MQSNQFKFGFLLTTKKQTLGNTHRVQEFCEVVPRTQFQQQVPFEENAESKTQKEGVLQNL